MFSPFPTLRMIRDPLNGRGLAPRGASGWRLAGRLRTVFASCLLLIGCASQTAGSGANSPVAKIGLPVSAAFDARGQLWRVYVAGSHVLVDKSSDLGRTFGPATVVNPDGQTLKAQSEDRPAIGVDQTGRVLVTYPAEGRQAITAYLAASTDQGRTFSEPRPVNERWQEVKDYQSKLVIDGRGRPYLFWHDERDRRDYHEIGLPLYYAVAEPAGSFDFPNRKAVNDTCECCRMAVAFERDDTPVVFSRMIYPGGIRDHGLIRRDGGTWTSWRVTSDEWKIEACPEHGPALSIGDDGVYHVAWFTQGAKRQGLFYARSTDRGRTFSEARAVGGRERLAGHADVRALGRRVALVWMEFDGTSNSVHLMQSDDGGATWSPGKRLAETHSEADYPFLLSDGRSLFLSWNTRIEGYRLAPLP